MLRKVVDGNAAGDGTLRFDCRADGVAVVADVGRLESVMAHLVENSLQAVGDLGNVLVRLGMKGREAIIEIIDDGPGMDADFVRNELFRPFKTTKSGGFGIGAYESREFVREMGGRLHVDSRPGEGTTITINLPAVSAGSDTGEKWQSVNA